MKKICWVTPDCFLDTDLQSNILDKILLSYDIHWIVVLYKSGRFKESDFDEIRRRRQNLKIDFVYFKHRARDIRTLFGFLKIYAKVHSVKADINYINIVPANPLSFPLFLLPKKKTIYTAHDGEVKSILTMRHLVKLAFKFYRMVKYVNMFSKSEADIFNLNFSRKQVFVIPLAAKDYGAASIEKRKDCISFLSFGTLHDEKNIGLLIEAANQLFEEGVENFKVSINGSWCVNWNIDDKIRHKSIFELNLNPIPNGDIPNLFGYNHYAVYPYKNMSQSGALKVAYFYNNPVIVTDLKGFTDEVEDNTDGYIFKSDDVLSLKQIMKKCIDDGFDGYNELQRKMRNHIEGKYSLENIANQYSQMFEKVLKNEL